MKCLSVMALLICTLPAAAQEPTFAKVRPEAVLQAQGPPIFCAAFSKDGTLLAAGGVDRAVHIWNIATGKKLAAIEAHKFPVNAVAFTPDGKQLVTASDDKSVRVWDLATKAEVFAFTDFKLAVIALAVSPDGKTLVAGTGKFDRKSFPEVKIFDLAKKKELAALPVTDPARPVNRGAEPRTIEFAPDGARFLTAVRGDATQAWSLEKRAIVNKYYIQYGFTMAATYAPDGGNVAAGASNGDIVLLDAKTLTQLARLKGQKDIAALSFSRDGRTLASGSRDGAVKVWDVTTLDVPPPVTVHAGKVPIAVSLFSPDGKTLAIAGFDGKLFLTSIERDAAVAKKAIPKIGPSGKALRLALVATERAAPVLNVVALAEAKLSAGGAVDLVERRAIDQLIAEQKLSLSGFVKHDQVLKVGKLLGVDLFAVLETDRQKKQAVGMVIFHAATGVRLHDSTLPDEGLEKTVDAVAQAVHAAVKKHERPTQATICLTTVRNVDLPREHDALCDLVGQLLERGLVSASNLTLLERTRLEQIQKERNLPTDSPLGAVLASLVRIELEVGRGADGKGLRGSALLVDNRGKELGKATALVTDQDPAALAEAFVREVAKPLKADPSRAVVDRLREVLRFSAEAAFFREHKDFVRSLKGRQAAQALRPEDVVLRAELAEALIDAGRSLFDPARGLVVQLKIPAEEDLARALSWLRQGADELHGVWRLKGDDPQFYAAMLRPAWYSLAQVLDALHMRPLAGDARELLANLQASNETLATLRHELLWNKVKDRPSYEHYTKRLGLAVDDFYFGRRSGLTDEQLRRLQSKLLTRWLEAAEKHGTPPLPADVWHGTFNLLRGIALLRNDAGARAYWTRLTKSGDPYALLYAQHAEFLIGVERDTPGDAEMQERVQAFRVFVQKLLASDAARADGVLRYHCYQAARDAIEHLERDMPGPRARRDEMAALFRFMVEQQDIVPPLVQATLYLHQGADRAGEAKRLALVNQILPLLKAPQARFLTDELFQKNQQALAWQRGEFQKKTLEDRRLILAKFPDLDRKLTEPWVKLRSLIDVAEAKSGVIRLIQPVVHENHVYVVGIEQTKTTPKGPGERILRLFRIPLDGGARLELGSLPLDARSFGQGPTAFNVTQRWNLAAGAIIHDERYVLATRDRGIFVFPLDGKKAQRLSTETGLPSDHVHGIACLDGKVYAGLGAPGKEGYLVACDLDTAATTILASSRRKDVESPLDDGPPFQTLACHADPKRQRILFHVWTGQAAASRKFSGLWQADAATGKLTQLHSLRVEGVSTAFDVEWSSLLKGDDGRDTLVLALHDATYLVDLATNRLEKHKVAAPPANRVVTFVEPRLPHLDSLKLGDKTLILRNGDFVHQRWLWSAVPFGRIRLDGSVKESFPNLRPAYVQSFQPWELFQLIGGRVVMADQHAIWAAELGKGK